jgi:cytidylate kinase
MTPFSSSDPTVSRLVEKQMRNWELARRQRLEASRPERPQLEEFICVSRQMGSGGRQVAAGLAERLGWPLFDKELLDAMSDDDAMRRRIYASMDQRDLSWWEEALRSLMDGTFVKNDYFRRLCRTLLSLARQGHAVFLGRGADLILPADQGLRVRLAAPFELRAARFAESNKVTFNEARSLLARTERERAAFIRRHFGVDSEDPTRHNLVINTGRCSIAAAVEIVLHSREVLLPALRPQQVSG